jgi:hypothetical protein
MAANKNKKPVVNVAEIDEQFGEFAVANYSESIYPALYYALREVMGLKCQTAMKQQNRTFDWKAFNQKYGEVMGSTEAGERRFSIEQLIQYSIEKTGHNAESLLEINRKSWERRKNGKNKNNDGDNQETVEDEF